MKTNNENVLGNRLRELRGALSQRQAADCVGIKPQNWNVYEAGISLPGAQIIRKICQHYGVSSDWLLGLGDVREVPREAFPMQPPIRPPLPRATHEAKSETSLLAEIATLKRRVEALEKTQNGPAFACG